MRPAPQRRAALAAVPGGIAQLTADPAVPAPDRVPRRAWGVLGLLMWFALLNFGDKAVLGLAGPQIVEDLGLSSTEFGTISSAFYLLFSLSALGVGLLGGRTRSSGLLAGIAIVWALAQLPILLPAAGFAALTGTRVLLGAGEGPALPVANRAAFTWFPAARRTMVAGAIAMGGALGVILGGPLLVGVIAFGGWRWGFGFLGLSGLVWLLCWLRWGGDGPYASGDDPGAAAPLPAAAGPGLPARVAAAHRAGMRVLRALARRRSWWAAVVAGFAAQWVLGLAVAWLPTLLQERGGYSRTQVGLLVGTPSLTALLAVPLVVLAHRRLTTAGTAVALRYAVAAVICAGLPAVALAGLAAGARGPLLVLGTALGFGCVVATGPLVAAALAELVPARACGSALAVTTAVTSLGAVVAPWATGRLLDVATDRAAGFDHALLLTAGLLVLGGLASTLLDPHRDRLVEELAE